MPKSLRLAFSIQMAGLPDGLEKHVLDTIIGAFKSREVLEAERPAHLPPYDEQNQRPYQ